MSSTVVCDYAGSVWELNSQNQNPCQVYAQLQGKCDPTFVISGENSALTPPPYQAPNNACGCNLVAYNLMGGCSWCQNSRASSWLTISQWTTNCTTTQYNPSGISASVSTSGIDIPAWAYITPTSGTWSPVQAYLGATSPNSTPYNDYRIAAAALYILLWIVLSILGCGFVMGGVAHYQRQARRRAWYMPTSAYHPTQRGGYAGVYGQVPYAPPRAVGATVPIGYAPPLHMPTGHPAGYVPSKAPATANPQPGSTVTTGFQQVGLTTTFAPPEPLPASNYQTAPGSSTLPGSHAAALDISVPSTPSWIQPPSMPVLSESEGVGSYYADEEVPPYTAVYSVHRVLGDPTSYPVEKATPSAARATNENGC